MKFCTELLFMAVAALGLFRPSLANPILSLSSFANLDAIGVGQALTIDVELTGLEVSQELDSLAATVVFNEVLLGTPSIAAGPIVPNPLDDPLDLLTTEAAGLADAAFLTFGLDGVDHITANGVFFSFAVTPVAIGSGNIAFDFIGATLFNAADPNDPTVLTVETGTPLSFVVIPEPSSLALAAVAMIGLAAHACCGWRRRA
jgi:hypothetical protein